MKATLLAILLAVTSATAGPTPPAFDPSKPFTVVETPMPADTQHIRVSISADADEGDTPSMVSAVSREFRKLDGVLVTDTLPELRILCRVMRLNWENGRRAGYAASVAITDSEDRFIDHTVLTYKTIDALAHEIAVSVDGAVIEQRRRAKVRKLTIDDILGPEESPRPSRSAPATSTPSVNP
jgi:hypothetical protein